VFLGLMIVIITCTVQHVNNPAQKGRTMHGKQSCTVLVAKYYNNKKLKKQMT
jgi:hypothetical protein